ncbi:MAG: hypothetical protein HGA45_34075 [Chloroflexales bacterium]|nr:hypothetical protein [Chloroflexales bacterium]
MKIFPKHITTGMVSMNFSIIALLTTLLLPVVIVVLPEPLSIRFFLPYVTVALGTSIIGVLVGALPRSLHPHNRIGIGMSIVALASLYSIIYC